jgi:hypothetical protein
MKGALLELGVLHGMLSFEWYNWIGRSAHVIQCIDRCKGTLSQMAKDCDYVLMTNTMKQHATFEEDFIISFCREKSLQTIALQHYSRFVDYMIEQGSQ